MVQDMRGKTNQIEGFQFLKRIRQEVGMKGAYNLFNEASAPLLSRHFIQQPI